MHSAPDCTGENLLRELAPQVLGAVIRRFGDFSAAEDAVQEALLAAALQWPKEGVPDNPRGWLYHVALRRITDHLRSEMARRRREEAGADGVPLTVDLGRCGRLGPSFREERPTEIEAASTDRQG